MDTDLKVPRFNVHKAPWKPIPGVPTGSVGDVGGHMAQLYFSPDQKRMAGTYRESGQWTHTFNYDEFVYVVSGRATAKVRGGESFELNPGDVAYFRAGLTVDLTASKDWQDVVCCMSDTPIKWP